MGAPRAGKSREGVVFIVETISGTDSVSQVAKIKGILIVEFPEKNYSQ